MQAGLYQGSYMTVDVQEDRMILRRRSLVPPKKRKNPELVRQTIGTFDGRGEVD
jgi:hypothetical protein